MHASSNLPIHPPRLVRNSLVRNKTLECIGSLIFLSGLVESGVGWHFLKLLQPVQRNYERPKLYMLVAGDFAIEVASFLPTRDYLCWVLVLVLVLGGREE